MGGDRLEDNQIVALYLQRNESAIAETKRKYGNYCRKIAQNILQNEQDAEECENDTYMEAWNAIPPHKPTVFPAFLSTITRRLALDKWRKKRAAKRAGSEEDIPLYELEECIPAQKNIDDAISEKELAQAISAFLRSLPQTQKDIFLRRYFECEPLAAIAEKHGFRLSKTAMILKRTREKLMNHLKKEGFFI